MTGRVCMYCVVALITHRNGQEPLPTCTSHNKSVCFPRCGYTGIVTQFLSRWHQQLGSLWCSEFQHTVITHCNINLVCCPAVLSDMCCVACYNTYTWLQQKASPFQDKLYQDIMGRSQSPDPVPMVLDEEALLSEFTDTLFSSLNHNFMFPDPRELCKCIFMEGIIGNQSDHFVLYKLQILYG